MSIVITFNSKGARLESVKAVIEAAVKEKYPNCHLSFERKEPAETRPARFSEAVGMVSEAKSEAESLRDELQEWHDNLPESLQYSTKADELDNAVQQLEEFIQYLDDAEGIEVEFPGMMG